MVGARASAAARALCRALVLGSVLRVASLRLFVCVCSCAYCLIALYTK